MNYTKHANYAGESFGSPYSGGLAGAQLSAKDNAPISQPDTLRGVLERLTALTKKASSVSGHASDVRSRLCGNYPTPDNCSTKGPTAVPNGVIEELQDALNDLSMALCSADDSLELVWEKIG